MIPVVTDRDRDVAYKWLEEWYGGNVDIPAGEQLASVIAAARAEERERCAEARAALGRLMEEWPDVTKATWDIAERIWQGGP